MKISERSLLICKSIKIIANLQKTREIKNKHSDFELIFCHSLLFYNEIFNHKINYDERTAC